MNYDLPTLSLMAPLDEMTTKHFVTGTVVITLDGSAYEVEFCDAPGRTVAMLDLPVGNLIHLHDAPEAVAA